MGALLRDHAAVIEGARLYAEGRFWDAHEAWERVWIVEKRGPRGGLVQALIQIAAAMHKLRVMRPKDADAIARGILARAGEKLAVYPGWYEGFDVAEIRADVAACARALAGEAGAAGAAAVAGEGAPIPRLRLVTRDASPK